MKTSSHMLTPEEFRQRLAQHVDPQRQLSGVAERQNVRDACHRWLALLAKHYGVSNERTQMWAHIYKGVNVALTSVQDADLERFAAICLEEIQADPAKVAACPAIHQMLTSELSCDHRDLAWRNAFVSRLRTHLATDLAHARQRWSQIKEGVIEE